MHPMWTLLRTELSAHSFTLRVFAVIAAGVTGLCLVVGGTPIVAACVLTAPFLPGSLFAQSDRAHLDAMYSILPVTRTQLVIGRYLLIALVMAVMTLAGLALTWVDALVRSAGGDSAPVSTAAVAGLALAVSGAGVAAQLPLCFAFGYARTRLYTVGGTMILMCGGPLVIKQFPDVLRRFVDLPLMIVRWAGEPRTGLIGLGVAVGLLAVSGVCSARLYRRRNL